MSIKEKKELMQRIDSALEDIRPHLAVDGGNVELVDVTDEMKVQIRWMGNCQSCDMSEMTLRAGLEQSIKSKIPAITGVEAVDSL